MQITVHLTPEVAKSFRKPGMDCPAASSLRSRLSNMKLKISPLHDGTDDPELFRHFHLEVANEVAAVPIVEELNQLPGVEAAYLKPPEGPPS